jgi:hypothetical protein
VLGLSIYINNTDISEEQLKILGGVHTLTLYYCRSVVDVSALKYNYLTITILLYTMESLIEEYNLIEYGDSNDDSIFLGGSFIHKHYKLGKKTLYWVRIN